MELRIRCAVLYYTFFVVHFQVLTNDSIGCFHVWRVPLDFERQHYTSWHPGTSWFGFHCVNSITWTHARWITFLSRPLHTQRDKQQSLYPHLVSNNDWIIIEPYNDTIPDHLCLSNGMKIRLKHTNTGRRLLSWRLQSVKEACKGSLLWIRGIWGDANAMISPLKLCLTKSAPAKLKERPCVRSKQFPIETCHDWTISLL